MVSMQEFLTRSACSGQSHADYCRWLNQLREAYPTKNTYTIEDLDKYARQRPYFRKFRPLVEKYLRLNHQLIEQKSSEFSVSPVNSVANNSTMTFEDALRKYLRHIQRKNYADATVDGYHEKLKVFNRFLEQHSINYLNEIDKYCIDAFKDHLYRVKHSRGRNYCVIYQKDILQGLSLFFRFLIEENLITKNPCSHLTLPRTEKRVTRNYLTRNEMDNFLSVIDTSTLPGFKARTVFELLYSTGMRTGEVRNLKVKDIDLEENLATIRDGKGKKDRVIILTEIAKRYLEIYIKEVRPLTMYSGCESGYLFPNTSGRKIKKTFLLPAIERYAELAEIDHHFSPLAFRHSFATHLLNDGVDFRHIQKLMGHESIDATLFYINIAINDLQSVLRKHHPRAKHLREKKIVFKGGDK